MSATAVPTDEHDPPSSPSVPPAPAADDPLSAGAARSVVPMGGSAGTGLAPPATEGSHRHDTTRSSSSKQPSPRSSPLARHGLVSSAAAGKRVGGAAAELVLPHVEASASSSSSSSSSSSLIYPPAGAGAGAYGGGRRRSGAHAARVEPVAAGSDPLLDAPPLGGGGGEAGTSSADIGTAGAGAKSTSTTPLYTGGEGTARSTPSLLDDRDALLVLESPSPVMIPRSEMKKKRQQQEEEESKGESTRGGKEEVMELYQRQRRQRYEELIGSSGDEAEVERELAAATTAQGGNDNNKDDPEPLFDSPSPVMVPRSEMKKKREQEEEEAKEGGHHYHPHQQHHHQMPMRQASGDPLGLDGGGGGGTPGDPPPVFDSPSPVMIPRSEMKKKEEDASIPPVASTAEPLHTDPVLARMLWSASDDGTGGGGRPVAGAHRPPLEDVAASTMASGHVASSSRKDNKMAGELCRTARWRIRLGLLQVPPPCADQEVVEPQNDSSPASLDDDADSRPVICASTAESLDHVTMSRLVAHNLDMLKQQRFRYEALAKRHYWNCQEIVGSFHGSTSDRTNDANEVAACQPQATDEDEGVAGATSSDAVAFDPLSALAAEAEFKQRREQEIDMEYRKARARQHLGLPDRANSNGNNGPKDSACGGSRFTEYYSSAEVLHVIEKDLHRLPLDHVETYHRRRLRGLGLEAQDGRPSYMYAKSNGSCGHDENAVEEDAKLLHESRAERSKLLGEVLFVYAREHKALGYRQGMHEILSYLLVAIEIDIEEAEEFESSARSAKEEEGSTKLLDFRFLRSDLYSIFEAVMRRLSRAYDTHSTKGQPTAHANEASLSPMDIMGESILAKVRDVAGDAILHRTVTSLGIPPPLFCTRWVRLMYAREVDGSQNVLDLWDSFFDIAAEEEAAKRAKQSDGEGITGDDELLASQSFMDVLEAAAASMILLVRERLLAGQRGGGDAAAMNDALNVLMNYPPMREVTIFLDLVKTIIWQQRRGTRMSVPPNRRGHNLGGDAAPSEATDRPKRRNSLSALLGLDSGPMSVPQHQATAATMEEASDGRSNEELATSLGTSVATIMTHLKNTSLDGNIAVPHDVWEALLDINNVGKDLMSREEK